MRGLLMKLAAVALCLGVTGASHAGPKPPPPKSKQLVPHLRGLPNVTGLSNGSQDTLKQFVPYGNGYYKSGSSRYFVPKDNGDCTWRLDPVNVDWYVRYPLWSRKQFVPTDVNPYARYSLSGRNQLDSIDEDDWYDWYLWRQYRYELELLGLAGLLGADGPP